MSEFKPNLIPLLPVGKEHQREIRQVKKNYSKQKISTLFRTILRPVVFVVGLLFSLTSPTFSGNPSNFDNLQTVSIYKAFNVCTPIPEVKLLREDLPGIGSSRIIPVEYEGQVYFWTTQSNPLDSNAYVYCLDSTGATIDSIPVLYVEDGEPSVLGSSILNGSVVIGSGKTINVRTPNGKIVTDSTFRITGNIKSVPALQRNAQGNLDIVVLTDSNYWEGGIPRFDTYLYTFVLNPLSHSLELDTTRWPIRFGFHFSYYNLAISNRSIFLPLAFYRDSFYSELYQIDLNTAQVSLLGDIGLAMIEGPVLFQRDNTLEVAVGAYKRNGNNTHGCLYIYNPTEADTVTETFCQSSTSGVGYLIFTDLNQDEYPDILLTTGNIQTGITLYALDGKTKGLLWSRNLTEAGVNQIATVDLDRNGTKEIIYRDRNIIYILNSDQNCQISSIDSIILGPHLYMRGSLYVGDINQDGLAELVVGAEKIINGISTDIYIVYLNRTLNIANCWPLDKGNPEATNCLNPSDVTPPLPPVLAKEILQNYPNPFDASTIIKFSLSEDDFVKVKIYNILGQTVRTLVNGYLPNGEHRVIWDSKNDKGKEVATGIYFYRLFTDKVTQTNKMILIR